MTRAEGRKPTARAPSWAKSRRAAASCSSPPARRVRSPARALEVFATGIRSALALLQLPDGLLLAASNGRDSIDSVDPRLSDEKLPHDMLLAVTQGSRHGWPYCFDLGRPSPEYPRANCRQYARPAILFPPHAAPLAMLAYRGTALAGAKGKFVVAYHGYRAAGHRVVAFATDTRGLAGRRLDRPRLGLDGSARGPAAGCAGRDAGTSRRIDPHPRGS